MLNNSAGFTLIELLITIALIGILSTVAIPSYQHYLRKAHYTEITQAIVPFKLGVEECFQLTGSLQECQAGSHSIPNNITTPNERGLLATLTVGDQGVITVTPQKRYGIQPTDTYILTPVIANDQLNWQSSGGGVTQGYAN